MPLRNMLCISIDGLRASALGTYGNAWPGTPALDALAARSRVFEWMLCDRPTREGFLHAVWKVPAVAADGPLPSPSAASENQTLPQRLAAADIASSLVTDDSFAAELAETCGFQEIRQIDFQAEATAATVADTELAQLFAVAIDQLARWAGAAADHEALPRRWLWLHARGYRGAWDAPAEFRDSLLSEDELESPEFVTPPTAESVADHDALLQFRAAYAAQTRVLDECIAALLAALEDFGLTDDTAIVLTGSRGFALGEHGRVGAEVTALYSELLHVPCLIHLPGGQAPPVRQSQLTQPRDLCSSIAEAFNLPEPAAPSSPLVGQLAIASNDSGEVALRTPAWMLRLPAVDLADSVAAVATADNDRAELYLKPDDRWEANEVASRMPEVTSRLLSLVETLRQGAAASLPTLDEDLASHPR